MIRFPSFVQVVALADKRALTSRNRAGWGQGLRPYSFPAPSVHIP